MEEVFQDMGVGSITCLHEFYQQRVLNYHNNMKETCHQLMAEYEKMKQPSVVKMETVPVIR